jgi:hypothetical protein
MARRHGERSTPLSGVIALGGPVDLGYGQINLGYPTGNYPLFQRGPRR